MRRAVTRWVAAAAVFAGAALLVPRAVAVAGVTPLASKVTWSDGQGDAGTLSFQGVVDGSVLRGMLRIKGAEVPVRATVASDGSVSGAVLRADGSTGGTFSGQLGADGVLRGSFDLEGAVGTWSSPADTFRTAVVP